MEQKQEEATGNWYVVLQETAFYPTGGGQPCDRGLIQGKPVTQVEEIDGEIRHYVGSPIEGETVTVDCTIEWERRFDHMQHHTGQHILSAAFVSTMDIDTVGFHLGEEVCTIDLDTATLTDDNLKKAELLSNQIILENRVIETKWVSQEELADYPLRKQPKVKEAIRLVIIPEFDYNGCGGTHPLGTGQVSAIKILGTERMRGKVRVKFVCGNRVLRQLHGKQEIVQRLTDHLNAPEEGLVEAVERLLLKEKELISAIDEKMELLLEYEVNDLLNSGEVVQWSEGQGNSDESLEDELFLVKKRYQDRSVKEMQKLAGMLIEKRESAAVILLNETTEGFQYVCARGNKVSKPNLKEKSPDILNLIDGKGGGRESQIQGGGSKTMTGEAFLEKMVNIITS